MRGIRVNEDSFSLQVRDKKMVLPGATKESLKALPEFKYAN